MPAADSLLRTIAKYYNDTEVSHAFGGYHTKGDVASGLVQYYLKHALVELRVVSRDVFDESQLEYYDTLYLSAISQAGRTTVSDLATSLGVTKPTVSVRVNKLVDEGYVTKVRSEEDGRVFWLTLSDKMKVAYSDEMRIAMAVEQELDDKYNPQEMERFAEMLRDASRLLDDLDKDYNDSHYYEAVEPRSHRQIPRGNQ